MVHIFKKADTHTTQWNLTISFLRLVTYFQWEVFTKKNLGDARSRRIKHRPAIHSSAPCGRLLVRDTAFFSFEIFEQASSAASLSQSSRIDDRTVALALPELNGRQTMSNDWSLFLRIADTKKKHNWHGIGTHRHRPFCTDGCLGRKRGLLVGLQLIGWNVQLWIEGIFRKMFKSFLRVSKKNTD